MTFTSIKASDFVSFILGGVTAIAIACGLGYAIERAMPKTDSAATLLCCIRSEPNADKASALFQQNIADAMTKAGLTIKRFSAPRPSQTGRYRQLTAILTAEGSNEGINMALSNLAQIEPRLAVASAEIAPAVSGAEQLQVTLAQWND